MARGQRWVLRAGYAVLLVTLPAWTTAGEEAKPSKEVAAIVEANNAFACDLYGKLREEKGNLFFSPFSISMALAMTKEGARGETEAQMRKVLHLPEGAVGPVFAALRKDLLDATKENGVELISANALWGKKGYAFRKEFLACLKEQYGAGLTEVDFAGDREGTAKAINAWVAKETGEKIAELFRPEELGTLTRLVLANAVCFKGRWEYQFDKQKTVEGPFTVRGSDKRILVPYMHRKGGFGYLPGDGFELLEMPYQGKRLSMVILVPMKSWRNEADLKPAEPLEALEARLTPANLSAWLAQARCTEIFIYIPRFQLAAKPDMNKALPALGMTDAFDVRKADFGLVAPDAVGNLFIEKVVHKAVVELNEEGTEAAAATGVVMAKADGPSHRTLRVDRPFLFLIRDNGTGAVLFAGRVINPLEGKETKDAPPDARPAGWKQPAK